MCFSDKEVVDYKKIDAHVHQFKGSSSRYKRLDCDGYIYYNSSLHERYKKYTHLMT
jgi:hypothetical protein